MAIIPGFGLKKIEFGEIAADGGVSAAFSQWGVTPDDETAQFTVGKPDIKEFRSIENDDPEFVFESKKGTAKFEGSMFDVSAATLEKAMGGTVVAGVYSSPSETFSLEQSVKAETITGNVITAVRCKVVFWLTWNFKKDNIAKLSYEATVLKPTKAATPSWTIADPVA